MMLSLCLLGAAFIWPLGPPNHPTNTPTAPLFRWVAPEITVVGYHEASEDFFSRVAAAGGALTVSQKDAIDDFVRFIYDNGIRIWIWRLNLYVGNNLAASMVPLFHGTNTAHYPIGMYTNDITTLAEGNFSTNSGLQNVGEVVCGMVNSMFPTGDLPGQNCFFVSMWKPHTMPFEGVMFGKANSAAIYAELYDGSFYGVIGNSLGYDNEYQNRFVAGIATTTLTNLVALEEDGITYVQQDSATIYSQSTLSDNITSETEPQYALPLQSYYDLYSLGYCFGAGMPKNKVDGLLGAVRELNEALGRY
jgi:hypothetical protein